MNQNWIVENLNNAFSTWNGKLTELWGLVTTSPQTFKGGAVWGVMQSLHNAMIGIGYALIVLFFAISLFKNTANFHELKRPEAAVHYLIRFVAAKTLVGYGMDIMLNIFSICNGVVSDMAAGMGGISQAMVALPGEVQSAIENVGFLASMFNIVRYNAKGNAPNGISIPADYNEYLAAFEARNLDAYVTAYQQAYQVMTAAQ